MIKLIPLLALLATGTLCAATPTARVIQVTATDRVASDVPFEVKPHGSGKEGLVVDFLVEGEHLVRFKKASCIVEQFSATGVKVPANLNKRTEFNDFFAKVSKDGTYGSFSVRLPLDSATQAKGIKLKGKITLLTGDKSKKHAPVSLPKKGEKEVRSGEFTLSRGNATSGFFSSQNNENKLAVTLSGPLNEIKNVTVTVQGKTLESNGTMTMNSTMTRSYSATSDADATVILETWSEQKEVVVPFSYSN